MPQHIGSDSKISQSTCTCSVNKKEPKWHENSDFEEKHGKIW